MEDLGTENSARNSDKRLLGADRMALYHARWMSCMQGHGVRRRRTAHRRSDRMAHGRRRQHVPRRPCRRVVLLRHELRGLLLLPVLLHDRRVALDLRGRWQLAAADLLRKIGG